MASEIQYKDLATGNIMTVTNDPSFQVKITVPNANTEWQLETIDPVRGSNKTSWVGNVPKPKN